MYDHGTAANHIPDETLVKEYLAGDRDAFATLYSRYVGMVTGYVAKRIFLNGMDKGDREDLVQEIFTEALSLLETFQEADYASDSDRYGSGAFRRWLFHKPVSYVMYRRGKRYWTDRQVYFRSKDQAERALREDSPTTTSATRVELPAAIRDALNTLPDTERRAVELHYLDGMPTPDIAHILGRTTPQTEHLIRKALRMLLNRTPDPGASAALRPGGVHLQMRHALLTAACELLTEQGALTGPEVAARVGRTDDIVYHYFDGITDLITQALRMLDPSVEAPALASFHKRRPDGQGRIDMLNAARELLAEKGTFTGPEVAARTGMRKSDVNRLFGSVANLRAEAAAQELAVAA